ncbi:MAG: signal peptide peptidase SppA [Thermoanaerobaculales bacterium]
MSDKKQNRLTGILGGLWKGLDQARRIFVNLLFLALIIVAIGFLFRDDGPDIADTTALVVAPKGRLVEQKTGQSLKQMIDEARDVAPPEILLKDVLDAIEAGKDDDRVQALVLDLRSFGGGWPTKLQDVAKALVDFRAGGKRVIAVSDHYEQDAYYIAAFADEVLMNPDGLVILEGYGRYKTYMKDGLDRLGIDVNVFRVGEFKSAVEPYLRDDMSPEAKEANLAWLGDLWDNWLEEVADARGLTVEQVESFATNFVSIVRDAGGNVAEAALEAGLIDATATRDEMRARLIELVGEDEDAHTYNHVSFMDFLEDLDEDRFGHKAKGDKVAVVVARGTIVDGSHPPGTIGGDSTSALIRKARNDDSVKAIVLRVDSGGGSAFASEVIRRELEVARDEGKIVVVSMGSVAASGGYWISMASDEVWAYPSTITGSIGIFGIFPTYQRPLAKHLGMRVDGVGTTPLAGAMRLDREMAPELGATIQTIIDKGYEDFITLVANARDMTPEEIDKIARGRVWSGEDAYGIGLVDSMGDLEDAIASAAKLAELGEDYAVTYIEKEPTFKDKVARMLLSRALKMVGPEALATEENPATELLRRAEAELMRLVALNDPNHAYALSMIEVD